MERHQAIPSSPRTDIYHQLSTDKHQAIHSCLRTDTKLSQAVQGQTPNYPKLSTRDRHLSTAVQGQTLSYPKLSGQGQTLSYPKLSKDRHQAIQSCPRTDTKLSSPVNLGQTSGYPQLSKDRHQAVPSCPPGTDTKLSQVVHQRQTSVSGKDIWLPPAVRKQVGSVA